MTVADLIHLLLQQDPRAVVVVPDPPFLDSIAKLRVGEVQPVRLNATEDLELVWLRLATDGLGRRDEDDRHCWQSRGVFSFAPGQREYFSPLARAVQLVYHGFKSGRHWLGLVVA
jgi:hypothetical protein